MVRSSGTAHIRTLKRHSVGSARKGVARMSAALLACGLMATSLINAYASPPHSTIRPDSVAATAPGGTITELDYVTNEPSHTLLGNALTACGKTLGITISRTSVPGANLLPQVLRDAANRSMPGLLLLDNQTVQQVAATGALAPLTSLGITSKGFYNSVVTAGSYKGKLYGLASGVNALALFYNKTLLSAVHMSPPTTWQQLRLDAARLTRGHTYGFAYAAPNGEEASFQFEPFMWSNGGDLTKLDGAPTVQALQFWATLLQQGSVPKSVLNWSQLDIGDQFAAGHVAMMVNGSWELASLDADKDLRYGVVPIPVPHASAKPVVPMGGEAWVIPHTDTTTERNAAAVLKCMLTGANVLKITGASAYVPSQPALTAVAVRHNPALAPFAAEIATARSRTAVLGPRYPVVSQALWTAIQEALVGSKTPSAALQQAQAQASGE